jgi:hypothetical protein
VSATDIDMASVTDSVNDCVPIYWADSRDIPFFRITATLFGPAFVAGASVLLASYDAQDPTTG